VKRDSKADWTKGLGCYGIALALLVLIAAVAWIGLSSNPGNPANEDIPALPAE
jgi:hypothetical protein